MMAEEIIQSCIAGCGACCITPEISSPIPGMPQGKPAGVRCVQLDAMNACMLFGLPSRPLVCSGFTPEPDMCSNGSIEALRWLADLERVTKRT